MSRFGDRCAATMVHRSHAMHRSIGANKEGDRDQGGQHERDRAHDPGPRTPPDVRPAIAANGRPQKHGQGLRRGEKLLTHFTGNQATRFHV